MDLELYGRVLWRFRVLVVIGLLVASVLALLSAVKLTWVDGSPRLSYRDAEQWESRVTLLVTEQGFPEGYKAPTPGEDVEEPTEAAARTPRFADPGRFAGLAVLYAHLIDIDPVRELLRRGGPVGGTVEASARASQSVGPLPFVDIVARAGSAARSMDLANRAAEALRDYLSQRQSANGIPRDERVVLAVVSHAQDAELVAGRPKARPVLAFLGTMLLVLAAAFGLENLRPRSATPPGGLRPSHS